MTRPLQVVHAIRSSGFAGVERHVCVLARAQAETGNLVTVIGGDPERMSQALQGADVRFLPGETVRAVTKAIARNAREADIVHSHMTAAEFAAALASLGPTRRRPLIATRHFAAPRGQSRFGRVVAGFISRRVSAQIAISQFVADRVEGSCEIVYPGVRAMETPQVLREPVVLVVQRFEAEKRTDVAVEAFARSGLADQGWRLRLAGDGSLRDDLEQQANDLGIAEAVDFLGMRSNIPELMAGASLMVAPCPIEGLGLGVLEAMGASLPVVASKAGGHLETLPDEAHRYCFPANDADAAARAIEELAASPELRRRLASQGLQRQQEHFTPAAQAASTAQIYDAVLFQKAS
ncbi:glycosyltransferase family 4 protein [Nesterenkonia salmonea]|uniref:Glycosyltransferase family 4 protein n=1 Tax=Nesterenkonia salmonea TaxID=1804987 RepID=A0A5R9BC23_9MICC|nr:glycosyltransferase family 4 protein [Nesterenkonia salmonea]TLP97049.1 glycosyltransferase family 4 protein [Nesterenkonia salmonea]